MNDNEININQIITENQNKLSFEEIENISKNIIHNSQWHHNIQYSPDNMIGNKININDNLYQDLEIFISYNHDVDDTVYKQINYTRTNLGDHYLKHLISNPTKDHKTLINRQSLIKTLINNPEKFNVITDLLNKLKLYQEDSLWIWKKKSPEFEQIFEILYFKNQYLHTFNTSEWFLKIYNYFQIIFIPVYGLLSPIIFFILPYIMIRFIFGIKVPIKLYFNIIKQTLWGGGLSSLFGNSRLMNISQLLYKGLTIFLYCYGIYNSFKAAYTLNNIINLIHKKVNHLANFIKTSYKLYQECKQLFNLEPLTVSYLELWDNIFEKDPYLLSDKGKILKTYYMLDYQNGKDKLISLMQNIGFIDSIHSIAYLYKQNLNHYSYPEYLINTQKPILDCNQIWNPFLNSSKAIKNDFKMGTENTPNNMLITGPNASGKSTFIKSVVLGVLMAQTITITPTQNMKISPFQLLNTYLNIPDAKGRESLFEAEMYRAKNHIDAVKILQPFEYSLVVMDEIFNSTNYEEGVAGAYIIANEIGNVKNSLSN